MGFGKLFWLGCNSVVNFFQVWMYEYFGVGPQVREEVDGIYPRFLHPLVAQIPFVNTLQVFFGSLAYVD